MDYWIDRLSNLVQCPICTVHILSARRLILRCFFYSEFKAQPFPLRQRLFLRCAQTRNNRIAKGSRSLGFGSKFRDKLGSFNVAWISIRQLLKCCYQDASPISEAIDFCLSFSERVASCAT
jgi:hypothetical protein